MSLLAGFLELIFPSRQECPFCRIPQDNQKICDRCLLSFTGFQQEPVCDKCGRYFEEDIRLKKISTDPEKACCRDCAENDRFFSYSRAAGPYEGFLKDAVHRYKYSGRRGLAIPFSEVMYKVMARDSNYSGVQAIVAVPVSGKRLSHRGFNQSELLAFGLADKTAIEVLPILRKIRETAPQAELNRVQRQENLLGAFALNDNPPILGKTLLLVDDVVTTASTLNCVSRVLMEGGARRVVALAMAAGRVSGDFAG